MTRFVFRNKTELPYLAKDNAYDFNYQETRRLTEEREILPGDSLQVICDYKTKGVRQQMSVVSTSEKTLTNLKLMRGPQI